MVFLIVNNNVHIKDTANMGLGMFSSRKLTRGLLVLSEPVVLGYESREQAIDSIVQDFSDLDDLAKLRLRRLYAGSRDPVPDARGTGPYAEHPDRLRSLMRYNGFMGLGTGFGLALAMSTINHSCSPNAFLYWNENAQNMELHALKEIGRDEQIFVSYVHDSPYATTQERAVRLAI
ncbi:set domain-containing protein 5 [Seiridium cupressi]